MKTPKNNISQPENQGRTTRHADIYQLLTRRLKARGAFRITATSPGRLHILQWMRLAWLSWKNDIHQSYWFVPSVMAAAAVVLAIASIRLEHLYHADILGNITWVYTRDPQGARDLLATVGGSLITVTGVVFSVTLVALTNASSEFGTRILDAFARDTGNKIVLGAFVGTFLYCLLVMRTVTGGSSSFVPHLSILIAIVLAMLCFGLLIYFIHHLIEILQSDNVIHALAHNLEETIARQYPHNIGQAPYRVEPSLPADFDNGTQAVAAAESGYVESIDSEEIMHTAQKHDVIVEIVHRPGDFIIAGMPLANVYPKSRRADENWNSIRRAFRIRSRRSYVQDIGYGFEQLQLVAIRAFSPAINNQILGINAGNRIIEGLIFLGKRDIPSRFRLDKHGRLRVIAYPVDYRAAVESSFDLLIDAARTSAAAVGRILLSLAAALEEPCASELREALLTAGEQLAERTLQQVSDPLGRSMVQKAQSTLRSKRLPKRAA